MRRTRPSGAVVSLSVVGYASHRDDFEPSSSRTSCFQIVHRASTHRRRIFSPLPPHPLSLFLSIYRLALYLHLVYFLSLSFSLSLCLSLSYIPFLPVIFITVLARSLARSLGCARARARASRACRGARTALQIAGKFAPRVSSAEIVIADERFPRVCPATADGESYAGDLALLAWWCDGVTTPRRAFVLAALLRDRRNRSARTWTGARAIAAPLLPHRVITVGCARPPRKGAP